MARFINDDIKLLHGGRRAVHITEDELQKRLWDFLYEREEIQDDYSYNPIPEKDDEVYIQLACCLYGDDMEKDLKYRNHCENFYSDIDDSEIDYVGTPLLGFQTLKDEFVFYGTLTNADWSFPVYSIFYFDGIRVRGYTPIRGNLVNTDFKCALGQEQEMTELDVNKRISKYQKLGIFTPSNSSISISDPFYRSGTDESWATIYLKKYGLDETSVYLDFNAIKEEIESRILL